MSKSKTQTSRRQAGSKSSGQQQTQNTPRSRSRRKAIARSRSKNRRDKTNISATASEILPVRPDLLDAVWPHVEPHLQRAVDESEGLIDIHDVREASGTGGDVGMGCFRHESGTIQGAYTTRIIAYPQRSASRRRSRRWFAAKSLAEYGSINQSKYTHAALGASSLKATAALLGAGYSATITGDLRITHFTRISNELPCQTHRSLPAVRRFV